MRPEWYGVGLVSSDKPRVVVPTPRPVAMREIQLIDRDEEMQVLREAADRAARGEGGVVLLHGEAGIGKSRLVAELKKREVMKRVTLFEGRAISIYLKSDYSSKVSGLGVITLHHTIKRARDNIEDDQIELRDEQDAVYVGDDPLSFQDSLLNIFYAESVYTGFKGVKVTNKFRFDNNYQYADARNIRWAGFITNALYTYKFTRRFKIEPQWKCWIEKGFSDPVSSLYSVNKQVNAFLLKLVYKLFDQTTITGGVQYKLVNLPLNAINEYDGWTYVFQLSSKAGTYPLVFGYKRDHKYYMNDPSKTTRDETTFIKIYMTK